MWELGCGTPGRLGHRETAASVGCEWAKQHWKQRCLNKSLKSKTGSGLSFLIHFTVGMSDFGLLAVVLDLP